MKAIIIGGVAAGMSAASKIKRMSPDAQVRVYEKGGFLSYGACGLPYYISGENQDYRALIARTPEQAQTLGIEPFLHHEVVKVSPQSKIVVVRDLKTNREFTDSYDCLLIATGCRAVLPSLREADER